MLFQSSKRHNSWSAAKVKYLLAAVLANGARQQFNKTKSEEDEQAYCFYLSRCLELLGPAIANDDKNWHQTLRMFY